MSRPSTRTVLTTSRPTAPTRRATGGPPGRRGRTPVLLAAALLALGTACGSGATAAGSAASPSAVSSPASPSAVSSSVGAAAPDGPTPGASAAGRSTSAGASPPDPFANLPGPQPLPARAPVGVTRVQISAIGVDSALVQLHRNTDDVLLAPTDPNVAGWYADGTVPGDAGPAVIAGHVDAHHGPAVFYNLKNLEQGDVVTITRSDGRVVRFRIDGVDRYPKDDFPTAAVYGATPDASLRLITCGGTFDYARHHYRDNVVAYASFLG